ncbi:hypothetical protein EI53_00531 [Fusobacterium naviforme]|nr:hypothetical protein EI53_00531 [Fusobacterium naviforme]STO26582.1 Uncharacterised protein [Fusobacterium naviforme]
MQLSEIGIKNYRLLIDAKLDVDAKTTLIVGRDNTAKTSCSFNNEMSSSSLDVR